MKEDVPLRLAGFDSVEYPEYEAGTGDGQPLVRPDAKILDEIKVTLEVQLGVAEISAARLFELRQGAVVPLQCSVSDLVEIRLNRNTIARGEIVAVDDCFGVRITE